MEGEVNWRKRLKSKWLKIGAAALGIALILSFGGLQVVAPQATAPEIEGLQVGFGNKVLTIGPEKVYAAGVADYSCDGVNDDVQFQAALDALPAGGGKLVVLAGDYVFGATVLRAIDNVTIQGVGRSSYIAWNGAGSLFDAGVQNNWVFRDIRFDAGGVDVVTATDWSFENVYIGATYYAYRVDAAITADEFAVPTGRGATVCVAASDSTASGKAQADYICDGTADDVEINLAITAANALSGGTVVLLDGTYTVADSIVPLSYVTLSLSPGATITIPNTLAAGYCVVKWDSGINAYDLIEFTMEGGTIDGNQAGQTAALRNSNIPPGPPTGEYMMGIFLAAQESQAHYLRRCRVRNVRVINTVATPIWMGRAGALNANQRTEDDIVENCRVADQFAPAGVVCHDAIYIAGDDVHALWNVVDGSRDCGIAQEIGDGSRIEFNIITNSYCRGIAAQGNDLHIIRNTIDTTITLDGMSVWGSVARGTSYRAMVMGNYVTNTIQNGIRVDYVESSQFCQNNAYALGWNGIHLQTNSHNNTIDGNYIESASQAVNNTHRGIVFESNCDGNMISNNVCRRGGLANQPLCGIGIINANCDLNMIHGNDLYISGAAIDLQDVGTNTRKRDNRALAGNAWLADV